MNEHHCSRPVAPQQRAASGMSEHHCSRPVAPRAAPVLPLPPSSPPRIYASRLQALPRQAPPPRLHICQDGRLHGRHSAGAAPFHRLPRLPANLRSKGAHTQGVQPLRRCGYSLKHCARTHNSEHWQPCAGLHSHMPPVCCPSKAQLCDGGPPCGPAPTQRSPPLLGCGWRRARPAAPARAPPTSAGGQAQRARQGGGVGFNNRRTLAQKRRRGGGAGSTGCQRRSARPSSTPAATPCAHAPAARATACPSPASGTGPTARRALERRPAPTARAAPHQKAPA